MNTQLWGTEAAVEWSSASVYAQRAAWYVTTHPSTIDPCLPCWNCIACWLKAFLCKRKCVCVCTVSQTSHSFFFYGLCFHSFFFSGLALARQFNHLKWPIERSQHSETSPAAGKDLMFLLILFWSALHHMCVSLIGCVSDHMCPVVVHSDLLLSPGSLNWIPQRPDRFFV